MRMARFSMVAIALWLAHSPIAGADEAQVLAKEPPSGALRTGQKVLVDDGTCPKGEVKEVTIAHEGKQGAIRQRRCVADPRTNK